MALRRLCCNPIAQREFFGLAQLSLAIAPAQCRSASTSSYVPPAQPFPIKDKGLSQVVGARSHAAKELSKLTRRLRKEGYLERWRHRLRHRITPSEQRVLDRKESESVRSKEKFRTMMGYILKRKERGF